MPSQSTHLGSQAEAAYRAAFDRLKHGRPTVLPLGSIVSQNTVAAEAGCKPGALKKGRFPSLVREIQQWISENPTPTTPSPRQVALKQRMRNRTLREQIADLKIQRDLAQSKLLEADSKILDLTIENAELRRKLPAISVREYKRSNGPK